MLDFRCRCKYAINLFSALACVTCCSCQVCPSTAILPHKKSISIHCLSKAWHKDVYVFMLELILASVKCKTQKKQKGEGKKSPPPSPPVWKRRAGKEGGGMRQRGEGKHKQKQLCLTSLLAERRKDWHKARATEQSRKRWKEGEGRGGQRNSRRRNRGEKRQKVGEKDAQERHQFSSARDK